MRTTCAGSGNGEVNPSKLEDNRQVHCHGRIHRLENRTGTYQRCVFLFTNDVHCIDNRGGTTIIAIQDTHFISFEKSLVNTGVAESLQSGEISIFSLFRQAETFTTI